MFAKQSKIGFSPVLPGISRRTLAYGHNSLLTEFRLCKGAVLPRHSHRQEQTGYLVSGRIQLHIGKDVFDCEAGDAWSIPGGIEHGADILEDSVAIEVFAPVRKDYLPA